MYTREALLPDAEHIYRLISNYSGDGTLLPRSFPEICENVRDFIVLERWGDDEDKNGGPEIIGCGALHLYGPHLAEIRSITVDPERQKAGCGRLLVEAVLAQAERHQVGCICLFTRTPDFFARLGFHVAQREALPDKINKDCVNCPRFHRCDEVAMVRGEIPSYSAASFSGHQLVSLEA
jgi:amino-acid N-acetyltransferase